MVEGKVTIVNDTGLHARPASQFIAFVNKFKDSDIYLLKDDRKANAKSILNILTMGFNKGTEATVQVTGGDEKEVLNDIIEFIENLKG